MSNRNSGCRIRDFMWRDHRCVTLENEGLRVLVAADKGADILEFLHKPTDTECLWQSPGGLRPGRFHPSSPLEAGHFREYFAGGWYEMLPNGPGPCEHRSARFGYHGEATLLPWSVAVEIDEPECVRVRFATELTRIPLRAAKTLDLRRGIPSLTISETIVNQAGQRVEFLWGQHPTFGAPLLEPGSRMMVPDCEIVVPDVVPADARLAGGQRTKWPLARGAAGQEIDLSIVPSTDARSHDFVRLENLEGGWYGVVNPARGVGFRLRYDHRLFPVLGFWQLFGGGPDYPWYRRHFLAALEPACDLPSLAGAAQRGTALALDPGESLETHFEAAIFTDIAEVKR
jgi:hypothetical protein